MTTLAVESFRRDSSYLRQLVQTLSEAEWAEPSGCAGWSVRDIVAHIGCALQEFVDLDALPPIEPGQHTERRQDLLVERTRTWPLEKVVSHYNEMVDRAASGLEAIATNDTPITFGALGTYPLHLAADGFAFDHYLHIREDLLQPTGPLAASPPPVDELAVQPVVNWICAAFPQQNRDALAQIGATVDLGIQPPDGRWLHVVCEPRSVSVRQGRAEASAATVTSAAHDFTLWATKRRDWRSLDVTISGDHEIAAAFCEAIRAY